MKNHAYGLCSFWIAVSLMTMLGCSKHETSDAGLNSTPAGPSRTSTPPSPDQGKGEAPSDLDQVLALSGKAPTVVANWIVDHCLSKGCDLDVYTTQIDQFLTIHCPAVEASATGLNTNNQDTACVIQRKTSTL